MLNGAVITLVSNYLICPFVLLVTYHKTYSSCNYKTKNNGKQKNFLPFQLVCESFISLLLLWLVKAPKFILNWRAYTVACQSHPWRCLQSGQICLQTDLYTLHYINRAKLFTENSAMARLWGQGPKCIPGAILEFGLKVCVISDTFCRPFSSDSTHKELYLLHFEQYFV